MAIWMDMTYSMSVWKGGLIGIIRAELEMAKNIHKINKDIKFCRATMDGFIEIPHEELNWLWESEKTGDAYLQKMGRISDTKQSSGDLPEGLKHAYGYSGGRLDRIKRFMYMCIRRTVLPLRPFAYFFFALLFIPLKILSMARQLILHGRLSDNPAKEVMKICQLKYHPFQDNDMIFFAGWYAYEGIIKEKLISQVKNELPKLKVSYLIYDLVLVNEDTAALYGVKNEFKRYLFWAVNNCDYIFYGGETAQKDAAKFFEKYNMPKRKGYFLKFGSDVSLKNENTDIEIVKKKFDIAGDYILAVGTVDAKKNYSTLYHAYVMLHEMADTKEIPQWVVVGGKYGDPILSESMELDPKVKDKIRFVRPSDEELVALYKHCMFTVLPTWYEGWSLTLPESLNYGKLCLASDVAPLREIGKDLVDYISPDDARAWAEKILYYTKNTEVTKKMNERIKQEYTVQRWIDCAKDLNQYLQEIDAEKSETAETQIFYDMSLAFFSAVSGGFVSGILRTQLALARYLGRIYPHMRFIAFTSKECIFLDRFLFSDLFFDQSIDKAFEDMRTVFRFIYEEKIGKLPDNKEYFSNGQIFWMLASILPGGLRSKMIDFSYEHRTKGRSESTNAQLLYPLPFQKEDILFSVGVGFSADLYETIRQEKEKKKFKYIQLLYDFTPILYPQVHTKETRTFYKNFLEKTYRFSDEVFYGGATAERDGIAYARENKLPARPSFPVKFGSNIEISIRKNEDKIRKELFERIGIEKDYIMAVGSIEMRKNHETLYLAYLNMLKNHEDVPQMLFCGYPGWKTEELIKRIKRDERVKDKIIIYSPKDEEMDILYKNCLFTVLASLYEGWSLTLPESLTYGKLCICTDADPLREIAGDLTEYVSAFDVKDWAAKIMKYYQNRELLKDMEEKIQKGWNQILWQDCAEQVGKELERIYRSNKELEDIVAVKK